MAASIANEFRLETLATQHNREAFRCHVQDLDHYLKTQASKDMRRKANAVFVMVGMDAPTRLVDSMRLILPAADHNQLDRARLK
jgi:hypothetical protein